MKTRTWMLLIGVMVALVAIIAVAPSISAQGAGGGYGPGGRMGGPGGSLVAVAADKLGMTQADLIAELRSGKTIADIAASRKVDTKVIVEAFVATRASRLAERVAAKQLTQAQADQMLTTIREHATAQLSQPWTARGPGMGNGRGPGFVDKDGDGMCDNAGARQPGNGRMRGGMGMGAGNR